jgi:hypothetical protein
MNADEIRKLGTKWRGNNSEERGIIPSPERMADGSAQTAILVEIAAQIAETNHYLKLLANPPILLDTSKLDLENFDPGSGILQIMEPRATLRDQFAMAALSGLLADPNGSLDCTETAYKVADSMMKARIK